MASKALNTKFKGNDYNQQLRMSKDLFYKFCPEERSELVKPPFHQAWSQLIVLPLCLKIEVKDSVYV